MISLRQLSVAYLVAAGAFSVSIFFAHHPAVAQAASSTAWYMWDRGNDAAVAINNHVLKPGWSLAQDERRALGERFSSNSSPGQVAMRIPMSPHERIMPNPQIMPEVPNDVQSDVKSAQPGVTLDLSAPPTIAAPALRSSTDSDSQVASLPPPPQTTAPQDPDEIAHVQQRLRDSLTKDMFDHFELFLYVSKADKGPWAQHMYVFQKRDGELAMLYDWPVSTGREKVEYNSAGEELPSFTPEGYYELDPHRFFEQYHSVQWDQDMPHAMFFNWEKDGLLTGLAIHAATGDDVSLLGTRSSAGCVRLAPENAALLYSLIRSKYAGLVPKFAFDKKTATISNDGVMVHSTDGRLELTKGYKVLLFIENYGGASDVVAALF